VTFFSGHKGELLKMEYTGKPNLLGPPGHLHGVAEERFEVLALGNIQKHYTFACLRVINHLSDSRHRWSPLCNF
jgi:hypothetical protein